MNARIERIQPTDTKARAIPSLEKLGAALSLAALLVVSPAVDASAQDEPGSERLRAVAVEVTAFVAHYNKTLEGGDEEAIRALFVADDRFAWFTDGAKSYSSSDDVLMAMRRYAGIRFETSVSNVDVVPLSASMASVRSNFRTELTIPDADNYEYGGVITWLLEKSSTSGAWQVLLGHTSTPGGPPRADDETER